MASLSCSWYSSTRYLYTQMGDMAKARADHTRLLSMDRDLAARLSQAIDKAAASTDDRAGIAGQYE